MLNFIDVEQNTDEWMHLRCGRLNGSKMGVVMAHYGKDFGEPAKRYAFDIAMERITGKPTPSGYKSADMERGHEEEPIARMAYEADTFSETKPGGFYCNDKIGCSPDFLVYDEGLGEIKCHIPHIHHAVIKRGTVEPCYKWQCYGNLKFTGRDWLDFVSYSAGYMDSKRLFICRINKADLKSEFDMIDKRVDEFLKLVDKNIAEIKGVK